MDIFDHSLKGITILPLLDLPLNLQIKEFNKQIPNLKLT